MKRNCSWPAIAAVALLIALTFSLAGCATIMKGGSSKSSVVFMQGTEDLKIWVDGKPVKWEWVGTSMTSSGNTSTIHQFPGVWLAASSAPYEIRIQQGGQETMYKATASVGGAWVVMNIFLGLGVGVIIDWATGAWYELDTQTVHVATLLNEKGQPIVQTE